MKRFSHYLGLAAILSWPSVHFAVATESSHEYSDQAVMISWTMSLAEKNSVGDLKFDGEVRTKSAADVRGLPAVVLVGLIALPSLVEAIVSVYRDLAIGGVMITKDNETVEIKTDLSLPYGVIVLVDERGVEVENFRSTPTVPDLSEAIARLAGGGKASTP